MGSICAPKSWWRLTAYFAQANRYNQKIASSKTNDQLTVPTTKWPNANGEKCTGITDSVSYVQPGCMETRHCDTVTHIITSQFCSFGSGLSHKQTAIFHH